VTSTDLLLRPASAEDADAVASIHLKARRSAPMPPLVHDDDSVRRWVAAKLGAGDETWVADRGGAAVGYARLAGSWLDDLYVDPDHAGQGVGSALLDLAKGLRPEGFSLWVFEMNAPARRFYARRGLVELEHTDGAGNEERAPDVRMAWPGREPLTFLGRLADELDADLARLSEARRRVADAVDRLRRA
jgi:GNAT superfamily N-acetyltransferase